MKLMLTRLAYGMWERAEIASWMLSVVIESQHIPGLTIMGEAIVNQLDVPSARNMCSFIMEERGCDALLMCDYDMIPNLDFVGAALKHLERHPASIIGAAYRSGWPDRCVQARRQNADGSLSYVPIAEAAELTGIHEFAVIGTGLCVVGAAAFKLLPWSKGPRFEYGYDPNPPFSVVATEDTMFCRKLRAAGGKCFMSFDHWCGHDKREIVGKPEATTAEVDGIDAMRAAGWELVGR